MTFGSNMDKCIIYLPTAESTKAAGNSLFNTLYVTPVTVFLYGEMGAGKTTFVQGFASAAGVRQSIVSPTYALEQRYQGIHEYIHIDLYRLNEKEALRLIEQTEDHDGIRCIEWAERLNPFQRDLGPAIDVFLKEDAVGRSLVCDFRDSTPLPTQEAIEQWRKELHLPAHVIRHCEAVAAFCRTLADALRAKGIILRTETLITAAKVHDLFRFVDFRAGVGPSFPADRDIEKCWAHWKAQYKGLTHESACAEFLRAEKFPILADIVEPHGLRLPSPARTKIEQKILYYADKRVREDTVVTLDERFEDFVQRYGSGKESEESKIWLEEAKKVERDLFSA